MIRLVRHNLSKSSAIKTVSFRKDGKLQKKVIDSTEKLHQQQKIQKLTEPIYADIDSIETTERYERKFEGVDNPIQKFFELEQQQGKTDSISEKKRLELLDNAEQEIWRKYNKYTNLAKEKRKDVDGQSSYMGKIESGPYAGKQRIFKPSFGKHTTFEYKINLAKTLADWQATEKVTEYVSKKFNVVLKTEFDGDFIEECYGKENMTYVDPNKQKFEKNKARTEAMMSKEKYSEWKEDIEKNSRVITVKNMEYRLKSAKKCDYLISVSNKLK